MTKPPWTKDRRGDHNRKHDYRKLLLLYSLLYDANGRPRSRRNGHRKLLAQFGVDLRTFHRFRRNYRAWLRFGTVNPSRIDLTKVLASVCKEKTDEQIVDHH